MSLINVDDVLAGLGGWGISTESISQNLERAMLGSDEQALEIYLTRESRSPLLIEAEKFLFPEEKTKERK